MFIFNYRFPLHIFLIFEKIETIIFLNKKITMNHYCVLLFSQWFNIFNKMLKNEFFLSNSLVLDMSAVDNLFNQNYINTFFNQNLFNSRRFFLFINYYFNLLKCKFSVFIPLEIQSKLQSIEKIYQNTSWLERETNELFGIFFSQKIDNRNLLLDYTQFEYPMRKDFNCEGYSEIYYNFFEHTTTILRSEIIEL